MNRIVASCAIFAKRNLGWFFNNRVRAIHHGIAKGFKRRGGIGLLGAFEKKTNEEIFIKSLNLIDKIVYDIGANFGAFSLYFSHAVGKNGHVVAFEPLNCNVDMIKENLRLNNISNVRVVPKGIGRTQSVLNICYDPTNTATASFNNEIQQKMVQSKFNKFDSMEIDSLDSIISKINLPLPDFVKIDVEGYELDVLYGMKHVLNTKSPELFIEIHGVDFKAKNINAISIIEFLSSNYYSALNIENNLWIDKNNAEQAASGHLYCRRIS